MIIEHPWIEPIEPDNIIHDDAVVATLWSRWHSDWFQKIGELAVVDAQSRVCGVVRPYDILYHLLQNRSDVYHLWPYTHVVNREWSERLNLLDQMRVGHLVRQPGAVIQIPAPNRRPSDRVFAEHMTPVLWGVHHDATLYGTVTLKRIAGLYASEHRN